MKFLRKMKDDARGGSHSAEMPLTRVKAGSKIELETLPPPGASSSLDSLVKRDGPAVEIPAFKIKKDEYGALSPESAEPGWSLRVEPADGKLLFSVRIPGVSPGNVRFPSAGDIKSITVDGVRISALPDGRLAGALAQGSWSLCGDTCVYSQSDDERVTRVSASPTRHQTEFLTAALKYNSFLDKIKNLETAEKMNGIPAAFEDYTEKLGSLNRALGKKAPAEKEKEELDAAAEKCGSLILAFPCLKDNRHAGALLKAMKDRAPAAPDMDTLLKSAGGYERGTNPEVRRALMDVTAARRDLAAAQCALLGKAALPPEPLTAVSAALAKKEPLDIPALDKEMGIKREPDTGAAAGKLRSEAAETPVTEAERILLIRGIRKTGAAQAGGESAAVIPLPRVRADSVIGLELSGRAGAGRGFLRRDGPAAEILAVRLRKDEYGSVKTEPAGDKKHLLRVEPAQGELRLSLPKTAASENIKVPSPADINAVIVDGVKISAVWESGMADRLQKGEWSWSGDSWRYTPSADDKLFGLPFAPGEEHDRFIKAALRYNSMDKTEKTARDIPAGEISELIRAADDYSKKLGELEAAKKSFTEAQKKLDDPGGAMTKGRAAGLRDELIAAGRGQTRKTDELEASARKCDKTLMSCGLPRDSAAVKSLRDALSNHREIKLDITALRKNTAAIGVGDAVSVCRSAGAAIFTPKGREILDSKLDRREALDFNELTKYLDVKRAPAGAKGD
jgi:hypothetical protein